MLDTLDAPAVRRWCAAGLAGLQRSRGQIDALNVYPVPDRDTGTNLVLTMQAASDALDTAPPDLAGSLRAMAHGALLGARGNSGIILSQLLRGLSEVLRGRVGGRLLTEGLERAAELCWAAVAEPVEGTVLSVLRAAATAARAVPDPTLVAVSRAAAAGARAALAQTPGQLAVLSRAGVVDAGGSGLCVLLDALADVVTDADEDGRDGGVGGAEGSGRDRDSGAVPVAAPPGTPAPVPVTADHLPDPEDSVEVQYLLDAPPERLPPLRDQLRGLGSSVVLVGGDGTWKVHVHTADAGAAIEAGIDAGRPHQIRVTPLTARGSGAGAPACATGPGTGTAAAAAAGTAAAGAPRAGRAVVALACGAGLGELLAAEGAYVVQALEPPSQAELLAAIRATGAAEVVLLPNNTASRSVVEAAAAAARAEGIATAVIPSRTPVQGLAGVAVQQPDRTLAEEAIAMSAAAAATRGGEVTTAPVAAQTSAGVCAAGDALGMLDGDVAVIGPDRATVAVTLLDRMLLGGGELVTLVTGAAAPPDLAPRLTGHLQRQWPAVEVVAYVGGQPYPDLLVGVE